MRTDHAVVRPRDLVLCTVCIAVGAWFVFLWSAFPPGNVSFDIYSYYLPNMLYAVQRLRAGGAGLLWNPFQNCGEPSFGISSTGVLYPSNLLFLVLGADRALRAVIAGNFAVAGIGMYWLARELGTGRAAALCGALAFELSMATVDLSTWGPQVSGSYVWLPVAMLFCERLLRAPTLGSSIGLGAALTLALLPGFPQVVFFTYQLIALRVLFELATRRLARPWNTLAAVGLGLVLAPLLDAVHLVPGIEMAARSVRGGNLNVEEIGAGGFVTWAFFRGALAFRADLFNPVVIVPCVVAGASWARAATRRRAIFYTLAGALYFALAFGPATPLFGLYLQLPLGALFRQPQRFAWMTSFCLAVLTGLGADAITWRSPDAAWWRRWSPVACIAAALTGVYLLSPVGLYRTEWVLSGLVIAGAVSAGFGGAWRRLAALLVVAGTALDLLSYASPALPVAINHFGTRQPPLRKLLPDATVLLSHAKVFASLRDAITAQERAYIVHRHPSFALMPKTASLFQVPSIQDYEPQPTRASVAYIVMLRTGVELTSLNQYYGAYGAVNFVPGFRKRLLDLAAARYVVVDAPAVDSVAVVSPPLHPVTLSQDPEVAVYENREALSRAFYVPRVEVVPDPQVLLRRLADGTDDLRQVAFVEEPPPSGFLGESDNSSGAAADFIVDEPERVVLRVRAPARGFLHLADQNFPGWRATVNGAPAPILPANHLFRAVEVPVGESTVEFRYQPASVRIGTAITVATLLALAIVAALRHRRRPIEPQ